MSSIPETVNWTHEKSCIINVNLIKVLYRRYTKCIFNN